MCERGGRVVLTDFGTAMTSDGHDSDDTGDTRNASGLAGTDGAHSVAGRRIGRHTALPGARVARRRQSLAAQRHLRARRAALPPGHGRLPGDRPLAARCARSPSRGPSNFARRSAQRDLPPAFVAVVDRALSVSAPDRFQSAADMAAALEAFVRPDRGAAADRTAHVPVAGFTADPVALPRSNTKRRRAAWAMVAAALIVAAVGVGIWRWRAAEPVAAGGVPAAARDLVLVAAFDGDPADSALARGVEGAVTLAVTRTPGFAPVLADRVNKMLPFMKRPPDTRLDAETARELALRDGGIRALVTGAITRTGTTRLLEAHLVVPESGQVLDTAAERLTSDDDARRASEALASKIAAALDVHRATLPAPVARFERVTTASFEALRAYTEGLEKYKERTRESAVAAHPHFERAIALDSSFAMAHTYPRLGRPDLAGRRCPLRGGRTTRRGCVHGGAALGAQQSPLGAQGRRNEAPPSEAVAGARPDELPCAARPRVPRPQPVRFVRGGGGQLVAAGGGAPDGSSDDLPDGPRVAGLCAVGGPGPGIRAAPQRARFKHGRRPSARLEVVRGIGAGMGPVGAGRCARGIPAPRDAVRHAGDGAEGALPPSP